MNHPFTASGTGADICGRCKYPHISHTDKAVCETCPNIGPVEIRYGNMLMCAECWAKEQIVKSVEETQKKDIYNQALQSSRAVDASIQIKTDVFNAKTTAILDLKKIIDSSSEITNKPYALAEELTNRFKHLTEVIFGHNEAIQDATSEQRAIQIYLNTLANTLRAEEREKLKIADINYKPGAVKPVKPKTILVKKSSKIDKVALKKYAIELGISEFMLQQVVVAKGIDVARAAEIIKASIAAAKGQ